MNLDPVGRADALVGNAIETAVRRHHQRRLRRLGWSHAFRDDAGDPCAWWADGHPVPRAGTRLDVLIDGEEAFPAMAEAIAAARTSVHLLGWHLEPSFALVRQEPPVVLGTLLAAAAARGVDVRVLVWAGAPVPAFHPTRKEVTSSVEALVRQTGIRCVTDPREHPVHCHHEKALVVDDEVAFVGGLDVTDYAGDRFDHRTHAARRRKGWHDVATRLRGPAVADVGDHFRLRWLEVTGERLDAGPVPPPVAGGSTVQVVRTVAEGMYERVPHGDFRILESYLRALRGARRFVYLENQFLWAPEIVRILVDKLRDPPAEGFRIVVLLPSKANNGQDDTQGQLSVLADADGGHERFLATTIRALTDGREDPVYVHAKVAIVDDRWLTVGSANLNAHSLFNDTEMNVVTDDAELARKTRERLWAEHLELPLDEIAGRDPIEVIDGSWRPSAMEQRARSDDGCPPTRRLIALPGVSRRSRRLLGALQALTDDG